MNMKRIKSWKLFESISIEKMCRGFLNDISDIDIPVDVEMYQPDPLGSEEDRVLILIGDEDNLSMSPDLPLYKNILNLISLNDYLIGEDYILKNIACWIKTDNDSVSGQRPITITDFDEFISKIGEIENWNKKPNAIPHSFKLVDMYYTNLKSNFNI